MHSLTVTAATDHSAWDAFLAAQRFRPFLQSWTMGEVYRDVGQQPIRLEANDGTRVRGICLALDVPARRGRHLSVPYGPVVDPNDREAAAAILEALSTEARARGCSFVRLSPHWPRESAPPPGTLPAPLHLLAEEIWYLPLRSVDPWKTEGGSAPRTEEELLAGMRKTVRNLIRRAEKEGVAVEASPDPVADLRHFIALHDETRKRHKFTPYSNAFFRAQVERFAPRKECTLYLARWQGTVIAASIHMHAFGETSYHHGASSAGHPKIPASQLLQWTAIKDALRRGDGVYNFWGIAPQVSGADGERAIADRRHPFAGVTLFKTGFGGELLPLLHCRDLPLSPTYRLTRAFEFLRKWKRGF